MATRKRIKKLRRDRQFLVLLSGEEKQQLSTLAAADGLTLSDTIRQLIRDKHREHQLAS